MKNFFSSLVLAVVAACSLIMCFDEVQIQYNLVKTTRAVTTARPPTCPFDLLTVPPTRPFEEVAILETDGRYASTVAEFRLVVAEAVCKSGGDAVIAKMNDSGYYPRGSIIHYTASQ